MDLDEARKLFEQGNFFLENKNFQEANNIYLKLKEHFPKRYSVLFNLARLNYEIGNYEESLSILLSIDENIENDYYYLLAYVYKNLKNNSFYLKYIYKFYKLTKSVKSAVELSDILSQLDRSRMARYFLKKAKKISGDEYYDFCSIFKFDYILTSRKDYLDNREKLDKELDFYLKSNFDFSNKEKIKIPTFIHAYNDFNNIELFKKIRNVLKKIYKIKDTSFGFNLEKNTKIKIGFISEYLTNHTIGKLFLGLIEKINTEIFDVYIFHSSKTEDGFLKTKFDLLNVKTFKLPIDLNEKVNFLRSFNLNIGFFTDIGMSHDLFYLTFFKVAKRQMTTWGHPDTTSEENIDYFLTSNLLELDNNYKKNYSENLIFLKYLPMYYYDPNIQIKKKTILNLYTCSQTLWKIHPDFDDYILTILKKDSKAKIIFIKDKNFILYKKLQRRFKQKFGKYYNKIYFINPLTKKNYIHLCGMSSVLLDPIYFGSGNSFHESMVYGTPTITMPNHFIRSRIVLGAYKQMRIDYSHYVANNINDYADKAVKLANNLKFNIECKNILKQNAKNYLFENFNVIDDFEKILKTIS